MDRAALAHAGAGLLLGAVVIVLASGAGRAGPPVHGPAVAQGREIGPDSLRKLRQQAGPTAHGVQLPSTSPAFGWDGPGRLVVVAWGSGSCPTYPERPEVVGAQRLHVALSSVRADTCTADLAPLYSVVLVPSPGVDQSQPVTVSYGTDADRVVITP